MLLEDKNAVVYGAGGSVGSGVARAFAREGARVFLAGRTPDAVERVAGEIVADGGRAEATRVDALDEGSVDHFVDGVRDMAGRIDVSFNAISHGDVHGMPLLEMPLDDFARPVINAVRAQFLTTRAAARHMVDQGSGVVLAITATTARMVIPQVGGTGVAFDAIESQCRQWAAELGPHGVRVACLQTTGMPEALHDTGEPIPDYGTGRSMTPDDLIAWMRGKTMLNRLTTLAELGNAAAFVASDRASAMTATVVNLTCGSVPS